MSEEQSSTTEAVETGLGEGPSGSRAAEFAGIVASHWKGLLVALLLGLTAAVLHDIGGWTIDTLTFALATVLTLVYLLYAIREDYKIE